MKLPRFLFDRLEHHAVERQQEGWEYEYLVAVCREPRYRLTPEAREP
jgi:hypothetical protein